MRPQAQEYPQWTSAVLDELQRQLFDHPDVETAGVLVGRRDVGAQTQVTAFIPVVRATAPGQRVVLTHDGIGRARETMGRYYRAESMVGWYLSRPEGAFLTPHDAAAHQEFFGREDQIGLVVDPRTALGGVYAVRDGELQLIYSGRITRPHGRAPGKRGAERRAAGTPWAGYAVLALVGFVLGAVLWLGAVVTGVL